MREVLASLLLASGVALAYPFGEVPDWFEPVATPEPEPIYAEVIVDALNLRDAPSTDGERIATLQRGDRVQILTWAVDYEMWSDYDWVEVLTEQGKGYVASNSFEERYLAFEHDFGSYELESEFDLDGDGTRERVYVGPGEMYFEEDHYYTSTGQNYYLPIVLRVSGSVNFEYRLIDIFLGLSETPVSLDELPVESTNPGCWSLYELVYEDFDGNGTRELGLNYGFIERSIWGGHQGNPELSCWSWFSVTEDGLRELVGWVEYVNEPYYLELGSAPVGNWRLTGSIEPRGDALVYRAMLTAMIDQDLYYERLQPLYVFSELGPGNTVGHTLAPPNYIAESTSWTFELELEYCSELGIYVLVCPPDNGYAWDIFESPTIRNLGQLVHLPYHWDRTSGWLLEPLTLLSLPEAGSVEAGVLEARTFVDTYGFPTGEGDWYMVFSTSWLLGWSRVRPPLEE